MALTEPMERKTIEFLRNEVPGRRIRLECTGQMVVLINEKACCPTAVQ